MRLIDHAGDGAITAERQPSDAPLRGLGMRLPLLVLIRRKELEMPFSVEFLCPKETDPRIEEQIEFLYADVEDLCERKMPQLVYQHEKRKGEYQLNCLYHIMNERINE